MEQESEGDFIWRASGVTDAQGRLSLSLPGLGNGRNYVLISNPYNGGFAFSGLIASPGNYEYQLGALEVTAINGADGSRLVNHRVGAVELFADGSSKWAAEGTTDAEGLVRLDLPGLGSGRRYGLYSFRPGDDSYFGGEELAGNGQYQFQVGHPLLDARVIDGLSGQPLADQEVFLLRHTSAGKRQFVGYAVTDAAGQAQFEQEELGAGAVFQMATRAFNDMTSFSEEITQGGAFTFSVGRLQVAVVRGADGTPLANHTVGAMERLANGSDLVVAAGITDAEGNIRFDLAGLGEGRNYVIYTQSPVDNSLKKSAALTANGMTTFTVGNQPLNVTLTSGLSGDSMAGQLVFVLAVDQSGSAEGIAYGTTDDQGKVSFDIDLQIPGKTIKLMTQPYNGGWVISDPITESGDTQFTVGRLSVRLRDTDFGLDMPSQSLTLLKRLETGELVPVETGITDEQGVITFDAPELDNGSTYSIYAENLFGMGKQFFSPWITSSGRSDFFVSREGEFTYDVTAPELLIVAPDQGRQVSAGGFLIHGTVSDNLALGDLVIEIDDESLGMSIHPVAVNNGHWSLVVPGEVLSPADSLGVTVRAYDRMGNEAAAQMSLQTVEDDMPPSLLVQSHGDLDTVSASGFLLTGFATDNVGLQEVTATVVDSSLGDLITAEKLELAPISGSWALVVSGLTDGGQVQLEVVARDFDGHETSSVFELNVVTASASVEQVINRITFGATPELLSETRGQDAAVYIEQQLNPASIDESALESMLADFGEPQTHTELQDYQTMRAVYAERQLLEKMAWFWENHFNTDLRKSGSVAYEFRENQQFRAHALGKFKDLLRVSATSPAMLIYLDNINNYNTGPNENYARELLELHTVGVNGGYTEADVVDAARVFTGWSTQNDKFRFIDMVHDKEPKFIMGSTFDASSGLDEGHQLLDMLASHPSTARRLCSKLQQYLVSDEPASQDVSDCTNVFLSSDGDIGEVIAWILNSSAFSAPREFKSKVKSPLEFMTGLARSLPQEMSYEHVRSYLWMMGMPSFYCESPEGWSELGIDWVNAGQLSMRAQAAISMMFSGDMSMGMFFESPAAWFIEQGYETEEAVLGHLVELAGSGAYSGVVWEEARNILRGSAQSFDINSDRGSVDIRLKAAAAVMLSAPDYNLQ